MSLETDYHVPQLELIDKTQDHLIKYKLRAEVKVTKPNSFS